MAVRQVYIDDGWCTVYGKYYTKNRGILHREGEKFCRSCNTWQPLENFRKQTKNADGLKTQCKDCCKLYEEKTADSRRIYSQVRRYGITPEYYEQLLQTQAYMCAICKVDLNTLHPKDIHIDHCHTTGLVRGILCRRCNHGLGMFRDDPKVLTNAINYLRGEVI